MSCHNHTGFLGMLYSNITSNISLILVTYSQLSSTTLNKIQLFYKKNVTYVVPSFSIDSKLNHGLVKKLDNDDSKALSGVYNY